MTIALMLATSFLIVKNSSRLIKQSSQDRITQANADQVKARAVDIESRILGYIDKGKTITNLMLQNFANEDERRRALDLVFFKDRDLVNIEIHRMKNGRSELYRRETNLDFLKQYELDASYMEKLRREKRFPIATVYGGHIEVRNSTLAKGAPLFTIGIPFPDDTGIVQHVALVDVRLDRLQKAFSSPNAVTLYLVDSEGSVLAHPDEKLAINGKNLSYLPIVSEALKKQARSGQKVFLDPEKSVSFAGAYSNTDFDVVVVAQVPEEVILDAARLVRVEAITLAGKALSVALFFVFLFSIWLTNPIEDLHQVTVQVAHGNFDVQAKIKSKDEVGDLAHSLNLMVAGLKERDKAKNLLNKFHGSSVTDDLMKNDLNLGGSRKDVTVLFSDIRDFTKFSEGHTPEEVVQMLNEYFQIMVGIITSNHGIVDKFVGDAIMAVWGAPQSTGNDSYYATKACLEMRSSLEKLNEVRTNRGQVPIKIGIGLHTGPAISGTIGSTERMEYTVIGDTVNMASRIEASTKAFGTDLLISDITAEHVENRFVLEFAGAAEVKGKSEPIKMFKVRGYFDEQGNPVQIRTPYSDFDPQAADKVKVAS